MSQQSPKPCAHSGCPALVYDGSGWCEKHKPIEGKFADRRRGSRHARGYGTAWDRLRLRVLERDCNRCQVCLAAGRISLARAVDHIVPKAQGGTDAPENLQSICDPCHRLKTQSEAAAGRMRRV